MKHYIGWQSFLVTTLIMNGFSEFSEETSNKLWIRIFRIIMLANFIKLVDFFNQLPVEEVFYQLNVFHFEIYGIILNGIFFICLNEVYCM